MVLHVFHRFFRRIEVDRSIVFVVMADMLIVQNFVRVRGISGLDSLVPLHGKALQWQTNHQQDAK